MSALFSHRTPLFTGPLSRVCANLQGAGAKFKHILAPGSPRLVKKPTTSLRGHINVDPPAEKFSTTATAAHWWSSQGSGSPTYRGRRVALVVAAGTSAVGLVWALHTGTSAAMALKVNLNSSEGDWKETKGETVQPRPRRFLI